ncbi:MULTISPECIES: MlaD family protein [unclassified Mycobacterium]|uniref:MCE family protein n=1 Tax=unclassified Mycobacterium TaxID=2642494 RepID=UPI0007401256|nr:MULTISPECIES: MlaD family protein [unclassified Mycobacterium]KUH83138.1 mammalian cell entry protein [Mycobacterium sp. GA-0227b]KUH84452.1 mammalian cell entry protein [Mycobacterium sp. GA-1999]KUH89412.1 mammalian cell entry protein [Mycobacterium sp. IS-1556]
MRLTRQTRIQFVVFVTVALAAITYVFFAYMRVPTHFFGIDRYRVTIQLPEDGGLYEGGNVAYRGYEVGRVDAVRLTDTGVEAVLALDSDIQIPADLRAEVHSVSAIGEQFVQLLPQSGQGPPLKNGDLIPQDRTHVPPGIASLLEATNRGLNAIPREDLNTVVDEAYIAVGGLGPELSRLVDGTTKLAADARRTLDAQIALIEEAKPVLDSQTESSDSIQAWAANLATITTQLQNNDAAVQSLLQDAAPAAEEARALFDRLRPTLPIVLANLVSTNEVLVAYRDNLEGILVLIPQTAKIIQAPQVANLNTKQDYNGAYLDFNLTLNIAKPCTTGYLPVQQQRAAAFEDYPDRPTGNLFCRTPQDSALNARGAKNYPCATKPDKRAPTAQLCESDEVYQPLNEGWNWKGDPNATLSGQDIPVVAGEEGAPPPPGVSPPLPAPPPPGAPPLPLYPAEYDPATGTYVGPDGRVHTHQNLAPGAGEERAWQDMLTPPPGN